MKDSAEKKQVPTLTREQAQTLVDDGTGDFEQISISTGDAHEISVTSIGNELRDVIAQLANCEHLPRNAVDRLIGEKFRLETHLRNADAFSGRSLKGKFEWAMRTIDIARKKNMVKENNKKIAAYRLWLESEMKKIGPMDAVIVEHEFIAKCKEIGDGLFGALSSCGLAHGEINRLYLVDALNAGPWEDFACDAVMLRSNGTPETFRFNVTQALDRDASDSGQHGRTSHDKKDEHLANGWISVMSRNGETILSIARCGCIGEKKEATGEFIALTFASQIKDFSQFREQVENGKGSQENPFSLKLTSLQLMSPNAFAGDKRLPFQQMKTLQNLTGKTIQVHIPDRDNAGKFIDVCVKIEEPLLFNFGCNWQHFLQLLRTFFLGSDGANRDSMVRLFGKDSIASSGNARMAMQFALDRNLDSSSRFVVAAGLFGEQSLVGQYLLDAKNSERDREIVLQLSAQIALIWTSEAHNSNPTNPYAMQERLAVLSSKLGYAVAINCKSGKDRTSMVCAAASTLAAEIDMSDPPTVADPYPPEGKTFDGVHMANCSTSIGASGGYHITEACTGHAGLMIKVLSTFLKLFNPSAIYGSVHALSVLVPL
ncbi:MAG: hypothetical protein LBT64_02400 [Puniceicoccales bacterium]|nr:hypothetical protein [Puniceicoccales bacterium]